MLFPSLPLLGHSCAMRPISSIPILHPPPISQPIIEGQPQRDSVLPLFLPMRSVNTLACLHILPVFAMLHPFSQNAHQPPNLPHKLPDSRGWPWSPFFQLGLHSGLRCLVLTPQLGAPWRQRLSSCRLWLGGAGSVVRVPTA